MKQYELLYMVGETKEANLDAIKSEVVTILTEEGATLREEKHQEFKRKFAYPVKHEARGTYVIEHFDLPEADDFDEGNVPADREDAVKNINRKLVLNQNILRGLVVIADKLPDFKVEELTRREERPRRTAGRGPRRYERPERPVRVVTPKAETATEEPKPKEENIDEKLEEILNI